MILDNSSNAYTAKDVVQAGKYMYLNVLEYTWMYLRVIDDTVHLHCIYYTLIFGNSKKLPSTWQRHFHVETSTIECTGAVMSLSQSYN